MVFNSALLYETALLKPYVQPLLFGVPRDSEEYREAKRLLNILDYFLPVPADCEPLCAIAAGYSDFTPAPLPDADDAARIIRL